MLFDSVAYKTCVSNGLVLDKNGNKMSKRLGNVVDPFKTIETFGADATRWYLVTNASPWDNMKFDLDGIKKYNANSSVQYIIPINSLLFIPMLMDLHSKKNISQLQNGRKLTAGFFLH